VAGAVRSEQDEDAEDRDEPRRGVKQTVTERIEAEALDRHGRRWRADHVMPLENLVQDDAVEEPTQADAQQDRRGHEPATPRRPVRAPSLSVHVLTFADAAERGRAGWLASRGNLVTSAVASCLAVPAA
jgi:hypothetical protein